MGVVTCAVTLALASQIKQVAEVQEATIESSLGAGAEFEGGDLDKTTRNLTNF